MYRYLHLDVFTSTPFEGNQLAVFPDPAGLDTNQMQRIAQEMAFSETTFIFPPEGDGDARMRIFTPAEELPIAGHPTIGSTFALAAHGAIQPGRRSFLYELGVGPTPVSLEWKESRLAFAWMAQPVPSVVGTIDDRPALAAALGIAEDDVAADLPVQALTNGVTFLYVPIRTRAAVDAVAIDRRALARCFQRAGMQEVPVFLLTTDGSGATVYSRMLAPGFGIAEDPATGAASGPLGVYLLQHRVVSPDEARGMVSLQGVAMGRPSRIHISIETKEGMIARVRVGGQSVLVGRGEIEVP